MITPRGTIAIMGSGETTDSMVRVHRYLLERLKPPVSAVFIDTPAGFQMHADDRARACGLVTSVPTSIARPLIDGLVNETIVRDGAAARLFPDVRDRVR